jgi:hypothetical protein
VFDENIQGNREKRSFDNMEKAELGKYVYALKDPRDGKVFYIGQGENDRIFDHFFEADACLRKRSIASSKVIRILDIWKNEEDVDWFIIAHKLHDNADFVEAAAIDVLSQSQNGSCLNAINGNHSSMLMQSDIELFRAQPINPDVPIERVFLFPIKNGLAEGKTSYEATRSAWYVKKAYQKLPAIAVGIKDKISVCSFSITGWKNYENKFEFDGIPDELLKNKKWNSILSKVMGYWQRGNYIIVSFNGQGMCKILRGAGQEDVWISLLE